MQVQRSFPVPEARWFDFTLLIGGVTCSGPLQSEAFLSSGLLWDRSRRCAALGADHHGHTLISCFCLLPARGGSVPAAGVLRQGH